MYLGELPVVLGSNDGSPSWLAQSLDIGKGLLALKQQNELQKLNMERLAKGLPALDASDVAVGAKVSMDSGQLNKILLSSAAALAAILLVMVVSRRRK